MPAERTRKTRIAASLRPWMFALAVVAAYGVLWMTTPDRTVHALHAAGRIAVQVSVPIALAVLMMFLFNRLVTPALATRFLGRGSGVKGVLLSSAAGIVSMGPVYAWYPFLASLKETGVTGFHLANFLCNRAVKPTLLPLLIAYFGWRFSIAFTLVSVVAAMGTATVVGIRNREG